MYTSVVFLLHYRQQYYFLYITYINSISNIIQKLILCLISCIHQCYFLYITHINSISYILCTKYFLHITLIIFFVYSGCQYYFFHITYNNSYVLHLEYWSHIININTISFQSNLWEKVKNMFGKIFKKVKWRQWNVKIEKIFIFPEFSEKRKWFPIGFMHDSENVKTYFSVTKWY